MPKDWKMELVGAYFETFFKILLNFLVKTEKIRKNFKNL